MAIPPDILQIASMLDDPDENVGVNLLAQLLCRADELGDLPGHLHESGDPVVRRRAHQLQAALTMRNRRNRFHNRLFSPEPALVRGLEELHLLWYDRDSQTELHEMVSGFVADFRNAGVKTLEDIEFFMRKKNILPENESVIKVENYCIGTVIDRRTGAASVLMALAAELAGSREFQLVRCMEQFAIFDRKDSILTGGGSWNLCKAPDLKSMELWNNRMILQFVSSTLLSCAVNSDSYRYIMSIAQAISGLPAEEVFPHFPYPFSMKQ